MALQMDLVPYPHPKHPNPSSLHQEIWGTPWRSKASSKAMLGE